MTDKMRQIVADTIREIVEGGFDVDVLLDCLMLTSFTHDYPECKKNKEVLELKEILESSASQFAKFEYAELKKIEEAIKFGVQERIKDESLTYVKTFRLLVAYIILTDIESDGEYKTPEGNSKITKCEEIFTKFCSRCFMELEIVRGIKAADNYDC